MHIIHIHSCIYICSYIYICIYMYIYLYYNAFNFSGCCSNWLSKYRCMVRFLGLSCFLWVPFYSGCSAILWFHEMPVKWIFPVQKEPGDVFPASPLFPAISIQTFSFFELAERDESPKEGLAVSPEEMAGLISRTLQLTFRSPVGLWKTCSMSLSEVQVCTMDKTSLSPFMRRWWMLIFDLQGLFQSWDCQVGDLHSSPKEQQPVVLKHQRKAGPAWSWVHLAGGGQLWCYEDSSVQGWCEYSQNRENHSNSRILESNPGLFLFYYILIILEANSSLINSLSFSKLYHHKSLYAGLFSFCTPYLPAREIWDKMFGTQWLHLEPHWVCDVLFFFSRFVPSSAVFEEAE